jgi:hypothetical protein
VPTFADFFSRLSSLPGEVYRRVSRTGPNGPSAAADDRRRQLLGYRSDYEIRDLMLAGRAYLPSRRGGALRDVLRLLGKSSAPTAQDEAKYPITPYFNPVPRICGFYANALGGKLGEDLEAETPDGSPADPAVSDALSRIWRWSNLDTRLGELTTLAANQGTVGIRIVADADARTVSLDWDPPQLIEEVAEDGRGNVIAVRLRYDTLRPDGRGGRESLATDEYIGKDGFSRIVDGAEELDAGERDNALGVCPYVLLRHARKPGSVFGVHAYEGSEAAIHGINYALSQTDESINAHVWPYLYAQGAGEKPKTFSTGRYTLVYSRLAQGIPAGSFEPMVPALDFAGAGAHVERLVSYVGDRQPETALEWLRVYANLSGETLQQALKRAEAACLAARVQYEDAVVRALQIALSWGVLMGLWDLGTGTGTARAADAAYDDGQGPEAFRFKARPALPLTPAARLADTQAEGAERALERDKAIDGEEAANPLPQEPGGDPGTNDPAAQAA